MHEGDARSGAVMVAQGKGGLKNSHGRVLLALALSLALSGSAGELHRLQLALRPGGQSALPAADALMWNVGGALALCSSPEGAGLERGGASAGAGTGSSSASSAGRSNDANE